MTVGTMVDLLMVAALSLTLYIAWVGRCTCDCGCDDDIDYEGDEE